MSFIDANAKDLGIEPICRELAVAPSSYHTHASRLLDPAKRSARTRRDDAIRQAISDVHEASFGLYGTRKVWHQLRREGVKVAKYTVERLMRTMGLSGIRRKKTCVTTVSNPKTPCPLDHVNRAFKVNRPNALWVVDFTYVHTWAGFVYVAFVVDAFARRIVGRKSAQPQPQASSWMRWSKQDMPLVPVPQTALSTKATGYAISGHKLHTAPCRSQAGSFGRQCRRLV